MCKKPKQFVTEIFKANILGFFVTSSITLTLYQQFKNHFEDAYTHSHKHTQKFHKLSMPEKMSTQAFMKWAGADYAD
jgi:hypothetical protein